MLKLKSPALELVACLLIQAASKALKEREAALLTLHAIEADLEKRRHSIVAIEEEGQKVRQHYQAGTSLLH